MSDVRIVVDLPKDIREAAQALANIEQVAFNDALVELLRRGLRPEVRIDLSKPFPCFAFEGSLAPITLEQTLEAED